MPLDARLNASLTQLLITILDKEILSPGQILSCKDAAVSKTRLPKGLTRHGDSNSCYINAALMFLFETMRYIPDLKTTWESFVEVVKLKGDEMFVWVICNTYSDLYESSKPAVSITDSSFKKYVDHEIWRTDPDSDLTGNLDESAINFGCLPGDSLRFLNLLKNHFSTCKNQDDLIRLANAWMDVFHVQQVFDLPQCIFGININTDEDDEACSGEFIMTIDLKPTPDMEPNYKLLMTIVNTGGHYIFFRRRNVYDDEWILYDDARVSIKPQFPQMSFYRHVLNLYQKV